MKSRFSPLDWLENHWATPAYGGWLLATLALCFFGAATNTMAGWLYVLSGLIFALLAIAAVIPVRSLLLLGLERLPIEPVSAGQDLTVVLTVKIAVKPRKPCCNSGIFCLILWENPREPRSRLFPAMANTLGPIIYPPNDAESTIGKRFSYALAHL